MVDKSKIKRFGDYLRKEKSPHFLAVGIDEETLALSCACAQEDLEHFLLSLVKKIPQFKESIIAVAEYIKSVDHRRTEKILAN